MTAGQIAKVQTADAHAGKMFNVKSDRFEHSANLTIDSLAQDDA